LTWHLLESAAPWLSKPFTDESFAFRDKYLGDANAGKPRAARCLESTEALLGEPLGRMYAERYFPPAAKAKVEEIVRTLRAVLKDDLGERKWMSEAARAQALAKIEAYDVKVGYRPSSFAATRSGPTWPRPGASASRSTAGASGSA
jgi:putative endopeptidase